MEGDSLTERKNVKEIKRERVCVLTSIKQNRCIDDHDWDQVVVLLSIQSTYHACSSRLFMLSL